ncbi:MAG: hypothetical protein GF408_05420 [Candidatus Omnitrophica bacterium]|nr:hypothetical protein [Candidatus Omnitrophota bacterium]
MTGTHTENTMSKQQKTILLLFAAVLFVFTAKAFFHAGEPSSGVTIRQGASEAGLTLPGLRAALERKRRVDINTASPIEMEAIPGIGPALASRIAGYRDSRGPFLSADELMDVKGIGPKKLEKMREYIRVE